MKRYYALFVAIVGLVCLGAALTEKSFRGTGGIGVSSNLNTHVVTVDGSAITGSGIPIQNGAGNNTTLTNPVLSGEIYDTGGNNRIAAIPFGSLTLKSTNGQAVVVVGAANGASVIGNLSASGNFTGGSNITSTSGTHIGNGSGLTNIPLAALQTNSTLNAQILTFNGTTWVPSNAPAAGSTQLVALAVGDFTGTNSILPALTNQLDIGSWSKPVRTNWVNDLTVKDAILTTGGGNFRLGGADTNGTTNVVFSSDFSGSIGAGTNAPQWKLHLRSSDTNSIAVFDSGVGQVARIETNTVTFKVSVSAPTNTANAGYVTNPIVSGLFYTNTTTCRMLLWVNFTMNDSTISGNPSLKMTNISSGDFYNATNSAVLAAGFSDRVSFWLNPSDYFIATNFSTGSASATVDNSFAIKQ